jgi:hypothetical protein
MYLGIAESLIDNEDSLAVNMAYEAHKKIDEIRQKIEDTQ